MGRHGIPKGGDLDRRYGRCIEDGRINGFQGANIPVIRDIGQYVSGQAIFQRGLEAQANSGSIEDPRQAIHEVGMDVTQPNDQLPSQERLAA